MENKVNISPVELTLVLIGAVLIAALATWGITRDVIHKQAIAHGAAHYTLHGSEALFAWGLEAK